LQEGLLDQICGIDFALEPPANLHPGQQSQIAAIQLQELSQGGAAPHPSQAEELLWIGTVVAAHGYGSLLE
jgi:hypothetical protein